MSGKDMEGFVSYLRDDCNCSDATITAYLSDLRRLEEWVEHPLCLLSRDDIDGYVEYMDETYAPASVSRKVSAIRRYYTWVGGGDLVAHLQVRMVAPRDPKVLSDKEFADLVARINQMDRPTRHRDKWMIAQIANGLSLNDACKDYGLTRQGLWKALKHYGVTPQVLVNTYRRGLR